MWIWARFRSCLLLVPLAATPAFGQSFDHSAYATVLTNFVHDSRVDYAALQIGRETLDRYIGQLSEVSAEEFADWPREERIAYLINAYNAMMMRIVIDHYPIKAGSFFSLKRHTHPNNSVRQIPGVFDGIHYRVAGEEMTLDDIEHGHLRPEYDEPRVHFALVCAAVSCPPLREEPFEGARLDEQLDEQGRTFLNDPRQNRIERERGRVYLSKIFDWFGDDFGTYLPASGYNGNDKARAVLAFVSRYLLSRDVEYLKNERYKVEHLDYDWTLNDQAIAASGQ